MGMSHLKVTETWTVTWLLLSLGCIDISSVTCWCGWSCEYSHHTTKK